MSGDEHKTQACNTINENNESKCFNCGGDKGPIDVANRKVFLTDGTGTKYDERLLATGRGRKLAGVRHGAAGSDAGQTLTDDGRRARLAIDQNHVREDSPGAHDPDSPQQPRDCPQKTLPSRTTQPGPSEPLLAKHKPRTSTEHRKTLRRQTRKKTDNVNNLFRLCDNCNGRFDNLLQAMETDEVTAPAGESAKLVEVVDKLSGIVSELSKRLDNRPKSSYAGIVGSGSQSYEPGSKRLREDEQYKQHQPPREKVKTICGTRTVQREIKTVVDEREQFWMYLGRLHHSHSVDDIAEMTQECLGLEVAPKVIRLVKKNVDVTKLPFVSFRVLLPDETRDVALQAETWSTGVAIREFDFDQVRAPRFRVPSSLCCRTICSCWLSRPGPVVGVNSGIFQASQPGKYTISSRTVSPPDNLPVSRILTLTAANAELEPSYSSATNLIHETMSSHRADGAETSRRTPHFHQDPANLRDNPSGSRMPHTMTPGRTLQSNEECSRPPYTVEPPNCSSIPEHG
ncbi:disulfide oxidoreductase [Culex quinquefasciatus]|uniref:Disulfide oxidoreductase n=1 Tax=Culex quinquefasciatus TaxID=7176 RepID=B0XIJ7_CULQU|nr:disulfide oxidoreductase [Culex quinquefasciatus]|eukprot:XP_001869469.1 disulfide oxidoreductase [Culex quinquefasciatus]